MGFRFSPLEMLELSPNFWKDRAVFVTGHTGFKGGWLTLWLNHLGAKVYGYSLEAPTEPSFYHVTALRDYLQDAVIGDVRDLAALRVAIRKVQPSVVFHMAAKSLVQDCYQTPVHTFETNVMGTVNLLEASLLAESVQAVINVTTDKCYENREWVWPYRESDRLGGSDPYSSSKACADIAASAYQTSFLDKAGIALASVRAGNVIGGGDWAANRLVPDFFRAIEGNKALYIRSPAAVRPWQHVLEPLCGYLLLAERLVVADSSFTGAWNFGPTDSGNKTVSWIADYLCRRFHAARWEPDDSKSPPETALLTLDSSKAKTKLGWKPKWSLEATLDRTVEWHEAWQKKHTMAEVSMRQIQAYEAL